MVVGACHVVDFSKNVFGKATKNQFEPCYCWCKIGFFDDFIVPYEEQVESNITDGFMKNLDQTYNSKYRTTSGYTNMICQKERAKMKVRKPIVKQPFLGEIITVCTYLLYTNP